MQFHSLYNVAKGQKITEQYLRRVLAISICGILLCMSCLVGTTWAWFTVSIENQENVIQIATLSAQVEIQYQGETVSEPSDGRYTLAKGVYSVILKVESDAAATDGLGHSRCPAYVLVTMSSGSEQVKHYYMVFDAGLGQQTKELGIDEDSTTVTFSVSWVKPASATPIGTDETLLGENPDETTEPSEDPTEESTESPEPTGEPTEETADSPQNTEPEDNTTETSEPTTATEETEATQSTEATENTESGDNPEDPEDPEQTQ